MGRPTHLSQTKIITLIVAALLIIGGGAWDITAHHNTTPKTTYLKSAAITQLTYHGQEGKNALELLKQHAKVVTKTSSLGEYVVSINGNDGGGKKYWSYYINGQLAQVGAGAYITHSTDVIKWKLQ